MITLMLLSPKYINSTSGLSDAICRGTCGRSQRVTRVLILGKSHTFHAELVVCVLCIGASEADRGFDPP